VTERRDRDGAPARARVHQPPLSGDPAPAADSLRDLQRQAGNKAVANLLGQAPVQTEAATRAIRLRDSLRSGQAPVQREFGLSVQRIDKATLKEPGRLLKRGLRGDDVAMVQQLLGVDADGIFGRRTRARVIEFQLTSGLVPDGIVGPLTFSALASATATTGKLAPTTDKLGAATADKIPSGSTDKIPSGSTDKFPSESTDKLGAASTDKEFGSTDKLPGSTDKQFESTDKEFESTAKLT
jgi:peptidoglycan hydrolase-like protein with peptidoglycan-binding domain